MIANPFGVCDHYYIIWLFFLNSHLACIIFVLREIEKQTKLRNLGFPIFILLLRGFFFFFCSFKFSCFKGFFSLEFVLPNNQTSMVIRSYSYIHGSVTLNVSSVHACLYTCLVNSYVANGECVFLILSLACVVLLNWR